jgi:hypothetical protein
VADLARGDRAWAAAAVLLRRGVVDAIEVVSTAAFGHRTPEA